jgi:hypothetical protein
MNKPNCCKCVHHKTIPGDAHFSCVNIKATVVGNKSGIKNGWFKWPFNFDPIWLISCDGFSDNPKKKIKFNKEQSSLMTIMSLLS